MILVQVALELLCVALTDTIAGESCARTILSDILNPRFWHITRKTPTPSYPKSPPKRIFAFAKALRGV